MKGYLKLDSFEKLAGAVSLALNRVACVAIIAMVSLATIDFIGVKVFRWGFAGSFEMVGLFGLIIVIFALPYTQLLRGHAEIDFVVNRLPKRAQAVIDSVVFLFALVLFALVTWQMFDYGGTLQASGGVTMTQGLPLSPFAYATASCCLVMCVILAVALVRGLKGGGK